ncbi:MAG TPA: hypothetical protein VGN72_00565 [Tepidisphaeraceae bacterium]|jgi:hypothetical protein|nr:hypothetical protein [Tepidisphaeraceae bacterium]
MLRHLMLVMFLLTTSIAQAQNSPTSALINEALDQPVNLQLNTTLPQALNAITDQTGVRIEVERAVWELLPWGQQTNVSANINNITLRAGLDSICQKLGLTAVLTERTVELRPLPALARLGRRATQQELQILDLLARTPLPEIAGEPRVRSLLAAIDERLESTRSGFATENRVGMELNDRPLSLRRGLSLYDALEAMNAQTEATWHPAGKTVVVLTKEDQIRTQLSKRVTRNYADVPIGQTLTELSQLAGVDFTVEPGAFQRIAPEFRTVKLLLDNASIEQALEHISGFTGLGYVINARGVYLWAAATGTPTTTGRDPVIALIEVTPGVQVLVPQSQVPPEARERLRTLTLQKIEELSREPATTRPTTAP